jgi:hypothetical protein
MRGRIGDEQASIRGEVHVVAGKLPKATKKKLYKWTKKSFR